MPTQQMNERTITLAAAVASPIVGKPLGTGGLEGVLNGGRRAVLTVVNSIAAAVSLTAYKQATRDATYVPIGPAVLVGASGTTAMYFDEEDCAAYALGVTALTGGNGDISVAWSVML